MMPQTKRPYYGIQLHEPIAMLGYIILYSYMFLNATLIKEWIPPIVIKLLLYADLAIVFLSIIIKCKYKIKEIFLIAFIGIVIVVVTRKADNNVMLFYFLYIIAFTNIKKERIAKVSLFLGILITVLTIVLMKMGLLRNLVYVQNNNQRIRQSLGFIYPTDFAAHIFYLLLIHFYLVKGKISILAFCVYVFLCYYIVRVCDARLSAVMILLLLITGIIIKIRKNKAIKPIIKHLITISFPIGAIITFGMLFLYETKSDLAIKLNNLLSYRLSIGNKMLSQYGISIFGQYIEQHGSGGTSDSVAQMYGEYTYIDMSFQRILQMYGILVFAVLMIYVVIMTKKQLDEGSYIIPIILTLIAINSIVDQHYTDFSYNIFLLMLIDQTKRNKSTLILRTLS